MYTRSSFYFLTFPVFLKSRFLDSFLLSVFSGIRLVIHLHLNANRQLKEKKASLFRGLPTVTAAPIVFLLRSYLNSRVFMSRNYRLILVPRKFDDCKTNIFLRSEASRANMLVLRTSNFQRVTLIRPIVPRHIPYIMIIFVAYH